MAELAAFELQHSTFNGFLFAEVGVEASGMPLSVLSALAREGLDPWQEAERLVKLPTTAAVDSLARVISALPASRWSHPHAMLIAARLVTLLPKADLPIGLSPQLATSGLLKRSGNGWLVVWVLAALLVGLTLKLFFR